MWFFALEASFSSMVACLFFFGVFLFCFVFKICYLEQVAGFGCGIFLLDSCRNTQYREIFPSNIFLLFFETFL